MKLEDLIGKTVGKYKLNEAFVNHNANFETASWWEDTRVEPGIYDIVVQKNPYDYRNPIGLAVKFHGKIVDDYFPSSFAGNIISAPLNHRIGEDRNISKKVNWEAAFQRYGASPASGDDKSPDIYLDPVVWDAALEYLKARVEKDLDSFDFFRKGKTGAAEKDEMEAVRSLKHGASWVAESTKNLEVALYAIELDKKPSFATLHKQNTAWATNPEPAPAPKAKNQKTTPTEPSL